ncbi:DUF1129 family protein [Paenibacillus wynnii]|uniref:DUF1129 domain-containing protein n=1 Tax=Paenibacillus wynnii TaxID=268407 RepID=A0A098MA50_9BACL|nr:DUF1129 family protein [Paenibacillus wynnii]KGE19424.1 hypothetical protein PWYN_08780 [Paenibacillus wynnii]
MKVKEMIKENNRLREQMTPFNRSYLEDMILVLRASRVDPLRTEELLLEAAQQMLIAQKKGNTATQVFGDDPEAYFKEVIETTPSRPARSKLNYYLMIPWTALTLLFGVMAIVGLISEWTTGSAGMFGQISLFTLLSVGLGSIIFIEMIMKWMSSLSDTDAPRVGKFNIKGFGVYIAIAVVVIYAGLYLSQLFPPFALSPWVSLILSIAGLLGLKFIFLK